MNATAQECLSVFDQGEEVDGFILYALVDPKVQPPASPDFPVDLDWTARGFKLHGNGWAVYGWDVVVHAWPSPDRFDEAASSLLSSLVDQGSSVAWIGTEGAPFADPPNLFSPSWMSGGVLRATTSDGQAFGRLRLDEPPSPVADADLDALRTHASGLASQGNP